VRLPQANHTSHADVFFDQPTDRPCADGSYVDADDFGTPKVTANHSRIAGLCLLANEVIEEGEVITRSTIENSVVRKLRCPALSGSQRSPCQARWVALSGPC
jgi:hypothetical protein